MVNKKALSCKHVLHLCNCQWGAIINKLCDSSYRHHLLLTHTHTHTNSSSDHSISLGYKSPGRTCVLLQHPSCLPLLFLLRSSPFNLRSFRSLSHLPFPIHNTSVLTISLPISFSSLLHFLSPSGYLFHRGRYIQCLTCSEKPVEIDVCSVALWAVTWHDGEFSLSFVQQQLFCRMFDVLQALGTQPIFHRWADCCRTLTRALSPYDLSVHGAINHSYTHEHKNIQENIHLWRILIASPLLLWFQENNQHKNSSEWTQTNVCKSGLIYQQMYLNLIWFSIAFAKGRNSSQGNKGDGKQC